MDPNRFNKEVRPFVPEVRIGTQGIAFDRLDLDAWWEDYKSKNLRTAGKLAESRVAERDHATGYYEVAGRALRRSKTRKRRR
jgi:hypothetical protein